MNAKQIAITAVLVAFASFTVFVVAEHGLVGLFEQALSSSATQQISLDLVIALGLFLIWMVGDARERGLSPLPYAVLVLCLGSIGALVYVLRREFAAAPEQAGARVAHG